MKRLSFVLVTLATVGASTADAQQVFHSTQSANLHTAEMLRPGSWLFEISHRFFPPVSDGSEALWGADGPSFIRMALTYQASERLMLGIVRSNLDDNLGFDARLALASGDVGGAVVKVAAAGGIAWNTQVVEISNPGGGQLREDNESQLYAQLLVNALLGERLAVGVAPSWLRNPNLIDVDAENALAVGLHGQLYVSDAVSLLAEWIFTEEIPGRTNDSGSFGVEFETRGHFFKLVFTNQTRLNPTQVLGGAAAPFELDELRFGFNITRLLPF